MAKAPRLAHIILGFKESCSLGVLINSKTIESLRVTSKDTIMKENHVRTLFYGLQTNFTLTLLDLAPKISLDQFQLLCTTLRRNYWLESLRVNLPSKKKKDSMLVAKELVNLFHDNGTLMNVWNYSHKSCIISDDYNNEVAQAIQRNKSIIECTFFSTRDKKAATRDKKAVFKCTQNVPLKCDPDISMLSAESQSTIGTKSSGESWSTIGAKSLLQDEIDAFCSLFDCSLYNSSTVNDVGTDLHNFMNAVDFYAKKKVKKMQTKGSVY